MFDKMFEKRLKRIEKRCEHQKAKQELIGKYTKYYPQRQGAKVSNVMLVVIIFAIVSYTIASFWLAYVRDVSIDSTLTTCFYTFWGTELALLAGIKVSKVIKTPSDDSAYTNDNMDEELEDEEDSNVE